MVNVSDSASFVNPARSSRLMIASSVVIGVLQLAWLLVGGLYTLFALLLGGADLRSGVLTVGDFVVTVAIFLACLLTAVFGVASVFIANFRPGVNKVRWLMSGVLLTGAGIAGGLAFLAAH
ncbi:MAG: hypothetical protein QOH97_2957 [Actinoplanes sp.]|jgi:hypothetical protein|nr:hypothetical protein [Actinoplanes sp.]